MTAYPHYLCHALLFQCIFAGEQDTNVSPRQSLQKYLRLIVSVQSSANEIVELNNYMSLVYSVVQSSFHDPQGKAFTYISKRFRLHSLANGYC